MYCPGSATCSARPTICQVRPKTVLRSSSAISASVYQRPGMVWASASEAVASKLATICSRECGISRPTEILNCAEPWRKLPLVKDDEDGQHHEDECSATVPADVFA